MHQGSPPGRVVGNPSPIAAGRLVLGLDADALLTADLNPLFAAEIAFGRLTDACPKGIGSVLIRLPKCSRTEFRSDRD